MVSKLPSEASDGSGGEHLRLCGWPAEFPSGTDRCIEMSVYLERKMQTVSFLLQNPTVIICHQCRPPASQMMLEASSVRVDCAAELLNQAACRVSVTSVVVFIANTSPAGRSSSWSHSKRSSASVAIATPCRREVPIACTLPSPCIVIDNGRSEEKLLSTVYGRQVGNCAKE